jgi:8-oxo-dGTP diphosphatase
VLEVSVVYIVSGASNNEKVLLGEKLTGLGRGKIVGPGGKREAHESPVETALREVWEEVGIELAPGSLVPLATITYPFLGRPELSQRSHAFVCRTFQGEPRNSLELAPAWWPREKLPLERMWADAQLWLPRVLAGEYLEATIEITPENTVHSADLNFQTLRRN